MNKRMNLFRDLKSPKSTSGISAPKISLDLYSGVTIVAIVFFVVSTGLRHVKHKAFMAKMASEQQERQLEFERMSKEVDALATQIEKKKAERLLASKSPTSKTDEIVSQKGSMGLDGTWTSILWKLSTFLGNEILVNKMEFGVVKDGDAMAANKKPVILEGQAQSISALHRWLEELSRNLPSADWELVKQGTGKDKKFPVEFLIRAAIL